MTIKNRDIYIKDPAKRTLVNEGVANVNEDLSEKAQEVLRYELETFVCDGQYQKGMEHILETYIKNIDKPQQPAVWVSGFYGSGKSHLIKMLRALWTDTRFPDGTSARNIAHLPQSIQDLFKELSTIGKRYGGLHAASGTLGSGASGSVRLALLGIIFKSASLPEQYPHARFVMWLKSEGILDQLRQQVEQGGGNWQEEIDNFYVAEALHESLIKVKPNLFSSVQICVETLNNMFPFVQDVSNDEMIKSIQSALAMDGKFPLTLIVLDEIQQYIGEDSHRSIDVQETVEACCKRIGGRLLFIGSGQTAVTGTSNLKKLEGRFTIRVELSDADVESVIRKVILAKKPDSLESIDQMAQINLGEISRHLSQTSISHSQDDLSHFAQDYPILPVRRRFWENTLRVLDQTGTDSQLRNQLAMVHKVIQTNLDKELGNVVPADYLYFDSADKLLQARILPRKVHEKTVTWNKGQEEERLLARACGLVFLINKLARSNQEVGIKPTIDTLADLLVENLSEGSGHLRSRLPKLLDSCEILMKVDDEYRIQTEESSAWNDEFLSKRSHLANEAHRIESERDDRIRRKFGDMVKKLTLVQGNSKVSREIYPVFDSKLPGDRDKKVYIWVRDGWGIDENSVRAEALQAGNQSPTIFNYIPKRSADELRHFLIEYKAASATLDKRGVPNTPEGMEARSAMETTKQNAEARIGEFLSECFSGARIFQGGGNEILGNNLQEMVHEAAENAMQRLYDRFHKADHAGWDKVYNNAKKGAADALIAVGHRDEPAQNPVCKDILSHIGSGKKGADIRTHFEDAPFGWSRDAVDGALQVLLISGIIRAHDERGQTIDPRELERKAIGKAIFKTEATTISTKQRIEIRKVLQKLVSLGKQGEEVTIVPEYIQKLQDLANAAGGDAPRPELPDQQIIQELRLSSGNEQLLLIYNRREELLENIETWNTTADNVRRRWPSWQALQQLLVHAGNLKAVQEAKQQVDAIIRQRLLLKEPNPVELLIKSLEDVLRSELLKSIQEYQQTHTRYLEHLQSDSNWQKISEDEQMGILRECRIDADFYRDVPNLSTREELLKHLNDYPIAGWRDRIDALANLYAQARAMAAKLCSPESRPIQLPRKTLSTEAEVDGYLSVLRQEMVSALKDGPIIIL